MNISRDRFKLGLTRRYFKLFSTYLSFCVVKIAMNDMLSRDFLVKKKFHHFPIATSSSPPTLFSLQKWMAANFLGFVLRPEKKFSFLRGFFLAGSTGQRTFWERGWGQWVGGWNVPSYKHYLARQLSLSREYQNTPLPSSGPAQCVDETYSSAKAT